MVDGSPALGFKYYVISDEAAQPLGEAKEEGSKPAKVRKAPNYLHIMGVETQALRLQGNWDIFFVSERKIKSLFFKVKR